MSAIKESKQTVASYLQLKIQIAEREIEWLGKPKDCWRVLIPFVDIKTFGIAAIIENLPNHIEGEFGVLSRTEGIDEKVVENNCMALRYAEMAAIAHVGLQAYSHHEGFEEGFAVANSLMDLYCQLEGGAAIVKRVRHLSRKKGGKNKKNYKGPLKSLVFEICEMLKISELKVNSKNVLGVLADDLSDNDEESDLLLTPLRNQLFSLKFPLRIADVELCRREKKLTLKIDGEEVPNVSFNRISKLITQFNKS